MIFLQQKQFFEKIITGQGRQLIVLNPFLDSLCNLGFKNIGLAPGIQKVCFQHPQDVVNNRRPCKIVSEIVFWKCLINMFREIGILLSRITDSVRLFFLRILFQPAGLIRDYCLLLNISCTFIPYCTLVKGQLISKCLFGAMVSTKKPTKIL